MLEEKLIDPNNLQADPVEVQKRIEAELGALMVRHCIKDVILQKLVGEINQYRLGVHRPVSGQNGVEESRK